MTCPRCKGDTELEILTNRGMPDLSPRYRVERCDLCRGKGTVPPWVAREWEDEHEE